MILYVKYIYSKNEDKAKRYLGMMSNILGHRISSETVNNIIYTK